MPGVVPTIEEFESARACGYTWVQWKELSQHEKVVSIAFCRASRLIDIHSQDASAMHSEEEMKKRR